MRASEFITEAAKAIKVKGLTLKYAFNDRALIMKAFEPSTGNPLAYVKFVKEKQELYPQDLWVHDDYRNRGIAKSMYDTLKSEGYVINRSHDQTKAGAGFWDKHRGEDAYVWEEVLDESKIVNYENIKLDVSIDGATIDIRALNPEGNQIGYVVFDRDGNTVVPDDVAVDEEYRNQGIAKTMYDYVKSLGFRIKASSDQTTAGKAFWQKHRGEERVWEEEVLDEMPLPADWDPAQYGRGTTFKQRLNYALERAKKLGTGSSRVAMIIEYQGRPTVLKVAKNQKGLAQNSVEADILSDGYASQLGILIPIIDYDEQNREPVWIHTEMAQKATEKQLCNIIGCDSLSQLVNMAWAITGKKRYLGDYQSYVTHLRKQGKTDDQIETMTDYANTLADLNNSFDVELGDFTRKANWGLYNGKPVIIDVGFNSNVMQQYYKESAEAEPTQTIKLRGFGPSEKVKEFIAKVYDMYPQSPLDPRQRAMTWGEGDDMQFAMFELVPSMSKRDSVEVKWIQAYPLRQGVGGKAMKQLQDLARQAGVGLTLYPWDKGQVKQGNLIKFYKKQGFKPTNRGAKNMYWDPNEKGMK